ncbi:MAG: two-component system, OmpR family, response regulator RegX3 [Chloroflexota bacterium]|nr:two-component system, OmpR family, response regulator RegX3 [Chloroflexota bacterium]
MRDRILLVEDDRSIRETTEMGLRAAGFDVITAATGDDALERFREAAPAAVVLDVMLPGIDGLEVCRRIRSGSATPVLMLTARTDTADVVLGLEAGADDYLRKPFAIAELVARLRAALRRASLDADAAPASDIVALGPLEIDPAAHAVVRDGVEVPLSHTEFQLLLELARHPGQVLSRDALLDRIWGYDYLGDSRLVDVAIGRLRGKVEADPARPQIILTVRGAGYKAVR